MLIKDVLLQKKDLNRLIRLDILLDLFGYGPKLSHSGMAGVGPCLFSPLKKGFMLGTHF